jgi:hypothetical protein
VIGNLDHPHYKCYLLILEDNKMRFHKFLNLLMAFTLLVLSGISVAPASAKKTFNTSPNSVLNWNSIAIRTIVTNAKQSPSHAVVSMAYVQAAVYDAVVTIQGGYKPYAHKSARRPQASVDAAVAAAAHGVLVHYFKDQQGPLDDDYNAALAALPNGKAKTDGIKVGQAAAASLIKLRQGDGYMADIGFTMPPAGPGVWQLQPGQSPLIPWMSKMKPFLLKSPHQFRPSSPPILVSAKYALEYNEVKEMGAANSPARTEEQTDAARFFTGHNVPQFNYAFHQIVQEQGYNSLEAARFLGMAYLTIADANIACYDAKYTYLFWRPQTAIQQGDLDGNPDTAADPAWAPLIGTPPHPEYTSGHGCYTGSAAEVMAHVRGTRSINVDLNTSAANVLQPVRHFNTVEELTEEVINVRVWSGIHFRSADLQGVMIGTKVANWVLDRYFLPTN